MKRIVFLLLPLIAVFALSACNTDNGDGLEVSNKKKLTYSKVEYVGDVEGTNFQRYVVTLWSAKKGTKADDFSKDVVSLSMELITAKSPAYNSIDAGTYTFSATEQLEYVITDSENSTLDIITPTTYGGDKARITEGVVIISSFKDKYEISGEITDAKGRVLEFTFYDELLFVVPQPSVIIDFENAELSAQSSTYSNILWGREKAVDVEGQSLFNGIFYTEADASFGSYYAFDGSYESWGGFALSSNHDLQDLGWDYSNQFSVYASSASKFAMGYYMGGEIGGQYGNPVIEFKESVTLLSAEITNSNKTYHYCVANPLVGEGESQENIWVNLIVAGYKSGVKTKDVTIKLAEGTDILNQWKSFDFSSLGEVDKVAFTIDSNSRNAYGLLVPTYFCIDNIAIK